MHFAFAYRYDARLFWGQHSLLADLGAKVDACRLTLAAANRRAMATVKARLRVLFFSEAVTLAHVVRPLALAAALDPGEYEVHFAAAYRYENYLHAAGFIYWPIESIGYEAFLNSVSGGKSAYDDEQLASYLGEEDQLIREVEPDLVVSDNRLTLCISAPAAGVPLININNAYWSPYRRDRHAPLPNYTRSTLYNLLPSRVARRVFPYPLIRTFYRFLQPVFQRGFLAPFNRARRARGLRAFASFESFYCSGDWTLYCDVPELFPLDGMPATHRFIGPLLWSPPGVQSLPQIEPARPVIFFSLGSSNEVEDCADIVAQLATKDVELLVATAGRYTLPALAGVHVQEFMPGIEAARRASLVICSGGSTAAYQALAVGTPVLGLPSNNDQHLAMGGIERAGAGLSVRADQANAANVCAAAIAILADPGFKERAMELAAVFARYDAPRNFADFVRELSLAGAARATPALGLQTLPERLRRRAQASPERPVFWHFDERSQGGPPLRYGEAWAQAQTLAAALRSRGLRVGEHVGFLAAIDPRWELMQMAVLLAGGVVVAIDPHDPAERVATITGQSEICAWVVQSAALLRERPSLFAGSPRFVVVFGEGTGAEGATPMAQLLAERRPDVDLVANPDWPATIVFSSGTTSAAKGIVYTHRQLTHAVRAISRAYRDLPEGVETLCWLPLSNLFQRLANLCAIERGGAITFLPHTGDLLESLALVRPQILIGVPRFFEKCEARLRKALARKPWPARLVFWASVGMARRYRGWRRSGRLLRFFAWPFFALLDATVLRPIRRACGGRLAYLVSGGAPLAARTIDFFAGLGFVPLEMYGTSENAMPIAMNQPQAFRFGTVGRPLGPNEVVLAADNEVRVKGPSVFAQYWRDSASPRFVDGYYCTADEARWERGYLQLIGRRADFVRLASGRRVVPAPIEQHFMRLPFVDQAVLLGNGRAGPALLVTIDMASLADGHKKAPLPLALPVLEPALRALKAQVERLPRRSWPLGILVLDRAFSVVGGEVTSNLKLRREAIEEKFAPVLQRLYGAEAKAATSGPPIWFLSAADVRMHELSALPPLAAMRTSTFARWLSLSALIGRCLWAYARYARELFARPWDYRVLQRQLLRVVLRSLRTTVGTLKGPLIKVGQTLSYVDVGLSPSVRGLLQDLQYNSPPLAPREIAAVVRRSLGKDPSELFDDWHEIPLAAASISQVHLARLKDGTRVAVKVRYPGIERIVRADLFALWLLLPLVSAITGIENIRANFEELRALLLGECDFRREAQAMQRFREIFADQPRILIPRLHPEYCSDAVLTMDYVEGQSYAEFKVSATPAQIDAAGATIYQFYAVAAMRHGLFHADPHPGNYLFCEDRVCFLDFGFCKEWTPDFIHQWKRQTRAVLANDLPEFTAATKKMGVSAEGGDFNYAALLACYRYIERMVYEDAPFRFTPEFVREEGRALFRHQIGIAKVVSPPELVAFTRLFWGQHSLLADLGAVINIHRLTMPLLDDAQPVMRPLTRSPAA